MIVEFNVDSKAEYSALSSRKNIKKEETKTNKNFCSRIIGCCIRQCGSEVSLKVIETGTIR